jgi:hypothetical protein
MSALSRRRFLNASAAGLGAASAAGLAAACSGPGAAATGTGIGRQVSASNLTNVILEAFKTHRLVGLGESHGLQNHHDVLDALLSDPRVPEVVDDIVVEFGNALYQPMMDRFIAGQPVGNADLRPAWRNTTQSPDETWDQPVYEQFFRTVRAANWTLPAGKQMRVLLGDPPVNWPEIRTFAQLRGYLVRRDSHPAALVRAQVLDKGRRALVCYGAEHLFHATPENITAIVKQQTGERMYIIADITYLAGDPGGLASRLSRYPRNTAISTAGTWFGAFPAGLLVSGGIASSGPGKPTNPWCHVPLSSFIDAGLYLGQPGDLTASWWNPAIYLDPKYWAELQRRNALTGNSADLASYRREQPAQYPLSQLAPSMECGKASHPG